MILRSSRSSSVVEHRFRKAGVVGSIPTFGSNVLLSTLLRRIRPEPGPFKPFAIAFSYRAGIPSECTDDVGVSESSSHSNRVPAAMDEKRCMKAAQVI